MIAQNMTPNDPSLWAIVIALASVVAWGGRHILTKLADCEDDREALHVKVGRLASVVAAKLGEVVELDSPHK